MAVFVLAAGRQARWHASGGEGLKQLLTIGGEQLIRRTFRLLSERGEHPIAVVEDPSLPAWEGLHAVACVREPWHGEMGKFLDARPYWPASGVITLLLGDVYRGLHHLTPKVYGRANAPGRRLEAFAFRFDRGRDGQLVDGRALASDALGLNVKGGMWRWFYRRHTGSDRDDWHRVKQLATAGNGWVEMPADSPVDDFDRLRDLKRWRARWGIAA